MKASCTCGEKAVGCVSAGGLPGAEETSEPALWRCIRRIARSHRFRHGRTRAARNRSTYRAAFVVWIAEPVGTRGIAVLASRMAAAAGISASGIVGAYFESGQPWWRHSRNSSFRLSKMAVFDRKHEASMRVAPLGLRVFFVANAQLRPACRLSISEKTSFESAWAKYLSAR
ncbi:hypothetical protein [Burkholderia anthina]|uniref:hypothetical protein n=1 Tax=Burkholderia anthina TaxID=179879 RepID=UPI0018C4BB8E|nr:hypothetical protein [Burkholderia anthina]